MRNKIIMKASAYTIQKHKQTHIQGPIIIYIDENEYWHISTCCCWAFDVCACWRVYCGRVLYNNLLVWPHYWIGNKRSPVINDGMVISIVFFISLSLRLASFVVVEFSWVVIMSWNTNRLLYNSIRLWWRGEDDADPTTTLMPVDAEIERRQQVRERVRKIVAYEYNAKCTQFSVISTLVINYLIGTY